MQYGASGMTVSSSLALRRPLRVCVVVPYDLCERGGVKHHVLEVAHALRKSGDEVSIVGPATVDPKLDGVTSFGGIVNIRSNASDNRMALFVSPWKLRRFFREGRFDVIHVHEPPIPSLPYWAAWLTPGVAKIATFHAYNETPSPGIRFGQRLCQVLVERFYDHTVAVSEAARKHASYAWRLPMTIVPNGVATDVFVPGAPRKREGKRLKLLFVGRLSDERKGLRVMLEAYQRLLARGLDVSIDLVGEQAGAPLPPALPGLTYHGSVARSALVRFYQDCDVYVAPSTGQESFGIVLLEAMATGAPVICSDIEGYRAVASRDGTVLVPPRDPETLALAIADVASAPDRRVHMSEVNIEHVKPYEWGHVAALVRNEYLVTLERRARRRGQPVLSAAPDP
jgi:phosphatidyl-myo-inositol alpha-mannosyltransferase